MPATMSIVGLLHYDPTIFDGMVLPNGVNKTRLIDAIVDECYDLEVLYPDPNYMKHSVTSWSNRRLWSWTKLYETMEFDYNPIWNKDGTITETETGTDSGTEEASDSGTETGTITDAGTSGGTGTATRKVRGFNEAALQATEENDTTYQNTADNTNTRNLSTSADRSKTTSGEHSITRTREEHGNIGVTTTQQMIREEREVSKFDIYEIIVSEFKEKYIIDVY